MLVPDISLSVSQRRPVCVIDPALALASREAPLTVLRLAKLFELWVPRAFWQILDASDFIEQQPLNSATKRTGSAVHEYSQEQFREYCDTIKIWQSLRSRRDTTGLGLRWLGDKLEESSLGSETDWEAIQRYEALAESMMGSESEADGFSPVSLEYATADALILAAALGSRFVIALAGANNDSGPMCCQTILSGKIPIKCINSTDSSTLIKREREQIRDLLAWGGAAMWSVKGASIAIVQVVAPMIWEKSLSDKEPIMSMDLALSNESSGAGVAIACHDYWKHATVFWYLVE